MADCPQINNTTIIGTSAVSYDSTPLPCTDAKACDDLNTILTKFDNVICSAVNSVNILSEEVMNITEDLMMITEEIENINNQIFICCPICEFTVTATELPVCEFTVTATELPPTCDFTGSVNQVPDPTTTTTSSSSTSTTSTSTSTSTSSSTTTTTTVACPNCTPQDVTIGSQIWTGCNLDVATYRNGDTIPQVTDPVAWAALTTGAWCYYNNDSANGVIYGKLYNWYAVNDPRGLAPTGYHIPSDAEWTTLTDYLGGLTIAGGKMKQVGLCNWETPNTDAIDSSGFTGLPGGFCSVNGSFSLIGRNSYWWSSSETNTVDAWYRTLYYNHGFAVRDYNL